ncbi:MAG: DUF192 domain-containing protein [Endomicrobium sp.]|jgi:uncharacterized membrane protein (UPF0127 family)|nr:DUF192 domain-containing protein [Endomicrobium sp.]
MEDISLNIPVVTAKTFWHKFRGFMFKKDSNYGLLFKSCKSVHTFFMRFDLDIVYLDKENRVIKIIKQLKPFRVTMYAKNAVSIIEAHSNMIRGIDSLIGKRLIDFI